jgi:hypothetical protein
MQFDFKSWSEVELRLKMENFIKEYVSLILLLQTIFTVAVGFYQTVSSASYCAGATEIHISFGPNKICLIIFCMTHTATMSQHQKALAPQMGILGAHSTLKKIHLAADSAHWN